MEIAHRIATVVALVVVVVALTLIESAPTLAPYLRRYGWVRGSQVVVMAVVAYFVMTRGVRWLITGRLVKWSPPSRTAGPPFSPGP